MSAGGKVQASTARLLVLTAGSVFFAEVLVMIVISWNKSSSELLNAIFDGILITLLLVPALYAFLVRPLRHTIDELAFLKEQLEMSREAYRTLIDSTEDSIYLVDASGRYRFINRHHTARLGLPESAVLDRTYSDLHPADKSAEFDLIIGEVIREGRSIRREHWSERDERCFLRTFTPVVDRSGAAVAVTVVSKDVTDLKLREQRLQELSITDELTGLTNRRGFEDLATHQLKLVERQGGDTALVYADVDNLKQINDTHGHEEGDRAIRAAARVLREVSRGSDVCARVGGDEFVVLLAGDAGEGVEKVADRIRDGVLRHNRSASTPWSLSLSVGVATCARGERCSLEELISRADHEMYATKLRRKTAAQQPELKSASG